MLVDDRLFSNQNACPHCGISYGEFTPRHFSFNSPYGACKTCSGLGTKLFLDPDLVVPDKTKSINDGAIVGIKDSSGDLVLTAEYIRRTRSKGFRVLAGRDVMILGTLVYGGVGCVAATANIVPALVVEIYEKFLAGERPVHLHAADVARHHGGAAARVGPKQRRPAAESSFPRRSVSGKWEFPPSTRMSPACISMVTAGRSFDRGMAASGKLVGVWPAHAPEAAA